MNLKKYLSKHLIVRLIVLFSLIGAAAIFDLYNATNCDFPETEQTSPEPENKGFGQLFFYNQVNSFNLKLTAHELSVRFRFAFSENKFLVKHYNLRTFQLMKAESIVSSFPSMSRFHYLPFNRLVYSSPDDTPTLS
jgi:hypothetical protein